MNAEETSYTYEFNFTPPPADGNKREDDAWIDYNCDNQTNIKKVANAFNETSEFLTTFDDEIAGLLLSQREANKVFELCFKLIDRIQLLNMVLIDNSDKMNASQVRISMNFRYFAALFSPVNN